MAADPQAYLIGIDGGGSGCRLTLRGPAGVELARVTAGPANVSTDFDTALGNVVEGLGRLMAQGRPSASDRVAYRLHAGLAGVITPELAARVRHGLMQALPGAECSVSDDREIQVLGALGGRDGYLLAVGTGSIVARARQGIISGVGGWGFVLSDQGSGADLGRAALAQCLLAHDGLRTHTPLTRDLLARHGGPAGLVRVAASATPNAFAQFAPLVIGAARDADDTALAIVHAAARHLDMSLAKLGLGSGDPLCLSGGLGPAYADFLESAQIARIVAPAGDALDGAILRARQRPHPA